MNSVTPGWLLSQSLTIGFRPSRGRRPGTWCGLGRFAQLMVRSARGACFLVEEVIAMCMSHLDSVSPRFLFFVEMDGVEPSSPRRVRRLYLPRFIPGKPNHHSHAVSGLGVSLSLYQVTVLRVLHGICTHVAWLVENIKLSRIVCINGFCLARDYFVRTLRQFVDVLRSVAARRVLAISPHGLTLARVSCPGIAPECSA